MKQQTQQQRELAAMRAAESFGAHARIYRETTVRLRASDLKDQTFPLRVRFAGGWKDVYSVTVDGNKVTLLDRDQKLVARVYGYCELRAQQLPQEGQ